MSQLTNCSQQTDTWRIRRRGRFYTWAIKKKRRINRVVSKMKAFISRSLWWSRWSHDIHLPRAGGCLAHRCDQSRLALPPGVFLCSQPEPHQAGSKRPPCTPPVHTCTKAASWPPRSAHLHLCGIRGSGLPTTHRSEPAAGVFPSTPRNVVLSKRAFSHLER